MPPKYASLGKIDFDSMWIKGEEEVPRRSRRIISDPKVLLTVFFFWRANYFYILDDVCSYNNFHKIYK
jgi:hypothetical protein